MSSVLKTPTPRPNLGRNGFDVSQRRIYSSPMGMLLPVYKDFAQPGDKYKINSQTFIRTEAVDTAAFIRIKHHLDWFFVTIQQMYRFWNEFFNGTQDVMTSFVTPDGTTKYDLPVCSLYETMWPTTGTFWVEDTPDGNTAYSVDEFGIPKIWNASRLMDLLGYGSISRNSYLHLNATPDVNDKWFPVFYLAYHKIFHSHYLNTDYFRNDPLEYNVDAYHGSTIPEANVYKIISHIHYRPYRKDYFTSIKPAPVFNNLWANGVAQNPMFQTSLGSPGQLGISYDSVNSDGFYKQRDTYYSSLNPVQPRVNSSDGYFMRGEVFQAGAESVVDTAIGNLRSMFALDRLARVTASAGSHYTDQTLAHLGFKVPRGLSEEAYYLGSQVTDIVINEVVATATTGDAGSTLGEIAGKGFGSSSPSKDISFECPSHGVIMAISSIEPLCDYASYRIDDQNRYLSPFDFYKPELDNLGMAPLWDSYAFADSFPITGFAKPLGWQPRYMENKIKYDIVNESFTQTHRKSWIGYKQSLYDDMSKVPGINIVPNLEAYFYVAPQYGNHLFEQGVPYYNILGGEYLKYTRPGFEDPNLTPEMIYASDNFLINCDMKVFKTSAMSVHSLPKYI